MPIVSRAASCVVAASRIFRWLQRVIRSEPVEINAACQDELLQVRYIMTGPTDANAC